MMARRTWTTTAGTQSRNPFTDSRPHPVKLSGALQLLEPISRILRSYQDAVVKEFSIKYQFVHQIQFCLMHSE